MFWVTFQLSAFTFGGGFVIVSLMKKIFVEKLKWLGEDEMLDYTALAQSSPGVIAVNASILVGWRIAGAAGAAVTVFATVLPPLIVLTVISFGYEAFRDNFVVQCVLRGMQAGIAAVIADVVITLALTIIKSKKLVFIILMAASFVTAAFFNVNVILVIAVGGLAGALYAAKTAKKSDALTGGQK